MGQCASSDLPLVHETVDYNFSTVDDSQDDKENQCSIEELSGMCIKTRRKSPRRHRSATSWMAKKIHRSSKGNDLSAAFNLFDYNAKMNLVNINIATEEELMTLSGVSRSVARNIVDYRNTIGGFRRIEDLALVSGIGAAKLQEIQTDITIKRKLPSDGSSRTQSLDSLPSCDSTKSHSQRSQCSPSQSHNEKILRSSPLRLVNVNSASIFDLMAVRGMNQEMAANIAHYRERKGPFRSVEDLIRVRGINGRVLSLLRMYLTVNEVPLTSPPVNDSFSIASSSRVPLLSNQKLPGHRRTRSAPDNSKILPTSPTMDNFRSSDSQRYSSDFSTDLYELLSLRSERPIVSSVFTGKCDGRTAIRIATWNLQQLTLDKVGNLGVLEVICRTILECGFSILALQEVGSKEVLEKICSELNQGTLRRIKEWNGPRGEWRWQVSEEPVGRMMRGIEYAAFIYNSCHGVQLNTCSVLGVHNNNNSGLNKSQSAFIRKPYFGYFSAGELNFVLVCLHIKTANSFYLRNQEIPEEEEQDVDENDSLLYEKKLEKNNSSINKGKLCQNIEESVLAPIVSALCDKLVNEKDIVLLGDFGFSPNEKGFHVLRKSMYNHVVPCDTSTNFISGNQNISATPCFDNIWLSDNLISYYMESWGVVREGLTHMAIPRGWGWGGTVSDHCPVYCDILTQKDISPHSLSPPLITLNGNINYKHPNKN